MKKTVSLLSALTLTASIFAGTSTSAATIDTKIDYVALGDSFALGLTSAGEHHKGYANAISSTFAEKGALRSFSKQYAAEGQTTAQLLEKLKTKEVQQAVKEAELITISIGSEDFEAFYKQDPEAQITPEQALDLLYYVKKRTKQAVQEIKILNPNAKIYLCGYYFPVPYMKESAKKEDLKTAFIKFNSDLASVARNESIEFIDVAQTIDSNPLEYVPSSGSIYPNSEGYQVFVNEFFNKFESPQFSSISHNGFHDKESGEFWSVAYFKNTSKDEKIKLLMDEEMHVRLGTKRYPAKAIITARTNKELEESAF